MSELTAVRGTLAPVKRGVALFLILLGGALVLSARVACAEDERLGPLTLDDCIRTALEKSPQLVSSEQSVVSARAGLTGARSGYYPQLSLGATEGPTGRWTDTAGGTTTTSQTDWQNQVNLSLNMTFWKSGRQESVAQSRLQLQTAETNYLGTTQQLIQQVAVAYYGVLAAQQLVGVAEAGVESARQHQYEVQKRIDLGATAPVDIYTADDDLARAELDLIDARAGVRSALSSLKLRLGVPYATDMELAAAERPGEQSIPTLEEAVSQALKQRPDVFASRLGLQSREYSLKLAKIGRGPALNVGGQARQGYTDFSAGDPSWNVLASVSWPLFDGGAAKAGEVSARAALTRAQADLQDLENQVASDVEGALIGVERAQQRVKVSATAYAAAEARLRGAEAKYGSGVGILLEVTDARASLTSAAASRVRAGFDYQVALVALQQALGALAPPAPRTQAPSVPQGAAPGEGSG